MGSNANKRIGQLKTELLPLNQDNHRDFETSHLKNRIFKIA